MHKNTNDFTQYLYMACIFFVSLGVSACNLEPNSHATFTSKEFRFNKIEPQLS